MSRYAKNSPPSLKARPLSTGSVESGAVSRGMSALSGLINELSNTSYDNEIAVKAIRNRIMELLAWVVSLKPDADNLALLDRQLKSIDIFLRDQRERETNTTPPPITIHVVGDDTNGPEPIE